jgi:hypothetical protein
MNLDRLVWRQRYSIPSKRRTPLIPQNAAPHSSHKTPDATHPTTQGMLNICDKLGLVHVPIVLITAFPKLIILPPSGTGTKQGVWPVCALVQSVLVWQGCSEENIHVFVIDKCKVRWSVWHLLRIMVPCEMATIFFSEISLYKLTLTKQSYERLYMYTLWAYFIEGPGWEIWRKEA